MSNDTQTTIEREIATLETAVAKANLYLAEHKNAKVRTQEKRLRQRLVKLGLSRWLRLKQWREEGTLPKVREFIDQTPEEFSKLPPERSYIVSWSLFQFLMSSADNRKAMNAMVRRQQRRRDFAPCSELLDEFYAGGVARLEKDWHAWIVRGASSVLPKPAPAAQKQEPETK